MTKMTMWGFFSLSEWLLWEINLNYGMEWIFSLLETPFHKTTFHSVAPHSRMLFFAYGLSNSRIHFPILEYQSETNSENPISRNTMLPYLTQNYISHLIFYFKFKPPTKPSQQQQLHHTSIELNLCYNNLHNSTCNPHCHGTCVLK